MTLTRYFQVEKVNKKTSPFVKDLDLYPGDIVQVSLEVKNKRAGGRNYASEVILKNWRNKEIKTSTLNLFAKFIDGDHIEYVECDSKLSPKGEYTERETLI